MDGFFYKPKYFRPIISDFTHCVYKQIFENGFSFLEERQPKIFKVLFDIKVALFIHSLNAVIDIKKRMS